jgi:hypothetical protein
MAQLTAPTADEVTRYDAIFQQMKDMPDALSGACAKDKWSGLALQPDVLMKIWALSDMRAGGTLNVCSMLIPTPTPSHAPRSEVADAHAALRHTPFASPTQPIPPPHRLWSIALRCT